MQNKKIKYREFVIKEYTKKDGSRYYRVFKGPLFTCPIATVIDCMALIDACYIRAEAKKKAKGK